jgi:hypothetical protein
MENLYTAIKTASTKLPDPNTYDKDDATIEVEFNGSQYMVTYHRQVVARGSSIRYTWGFENESFIN